MTDYSSVKNTAKNGKLIRAEIREYLLAMALVYGFSQEKVWTEGFYPYNLHRQKQCTLLFLPVVPENKDYRAILFHENLIQTFKHYFKEFVSSEFLDPNHVLFFDTKKFRIYYDRLKYGRKQENGEYKVNLHKTMQYMWTPVLITMLYLYGYDKEKQAIDLNKFWFFKECWNVNDTICRLVLWLTTVGYKKTGDLGDVNHIDGHYLWLEKPDLWEKTAYDNVDFITKKLAAGKYI